MRKAPGIFLLMILVSACGNKSEQLAKQAGQEIHFSETTYDFGEIEQHADGMATFEFKNIGDAPIVVNNVRTTCGCTAPQWSQDPIEPGETGMIKIRYNTSITGSFIRSSYVHSSAANSPVKLTMKGRVIEKDGAEKKEVWEPGDRPELK